jgi:CAP-Gly domain-containing linker protein 3/4
MDDGSVTAHVYKHKNGTLDPFKGADSELRCKWTNMNALHYAVFFDVPEIVDTLLQHKPALLHSTCQEYEEGTALHIAASNLSLQATQILISHGADCTVTDKNGRTPLDLLPSNQTGAEGEVIVQMTSLLKSAMEKKKEREIVLVEEGGSEDVRAGGGEGVMKRREEDKENAMEIELSVESEEKLKPKTPLGKPPPAAKSHQSSSLAVKKTHSPRVRDSIRTRGTRSPVSTVSLSSGSSRAASPVVEEVTMHTLGLKIGDRILIDKSSTKSKNGTLRFGGSTEFAVGQWAGVELEDPIGKNDGSCMGIRYFTCKPKFGLFVPMHRVTKAPPTHLATDRRKKSANGKRETSVALSPRTFDAQGALPFNTDLQVGDRVTVGGSRTGTLKFAGTVKFAPGIWMGVELDNSHGKNDGSRAGVRYFRCKPNHGVFVLPSKVKRSARNPSVTIVVL